MENNHKLSDSVMEHLMSDAKVMPYAVRVFGGAYFCVKEIEEGADPCKTLTKYIPTMLELAHFYNLEAEYAIEKFFDYTLMDKRLYAHYFSAIWNLVI